MTSIFLLATVAMCQESLRIEVFSPNVWRPDPPAANWRYRTEKDFESNGIIIRAPKPGDDFDKWRKALEAFREDARKGRPECAVLHYDGARAWIKLRFDVARKLAISPNESVTVSCEAKCTDGSGQFGLAYEIRDLNGQWQAWSNGIPDHNAVLNDGKWHSVSFTATPPWFDSKVQYAVPILGQDAVLSKEKGTIEIRKLRIEIASSPARSKFTKTLNPALDFSIYDRKELAWASKAFTSSFLFLYDATVYRPIPDMLDVNPFMDRMKIRYGGADVVLLWQAYPRIGVDDRNQFDFFRDLPGGLNGLKKVVAQIHKRGAKAMIPYNPWDTGTRREGVSDAVALASIVKAIGADGVFLDTMSEPQSGLREELDKITLGQSLEPEGVLPDDAELGVCDSSWAQWLPYYDTPGILRHKWIEPRHMQHQIRRWNSNHMLELDHAFLNVSGMLVWENVFGTWNPWNDLDASQWSIDCKVMKWIQPYVDAGTWIPFVKTDLSGSFANAWATKDETIVLIVNPLEGGVASSQKFGDNGAPYFSFPISDVFGVNPLHHYAESYWKTMEAKGRLDFYRILWQRCFAPPRHEPLLDPGDHTSLNPARTPAAGRSEPPKDMVFIRNGKVHMKITHQRRECGCYPDPIPGLGDPRLEAYDSKKWTWGDPWWQDLTHDYYESVSSYFMDEVLVSNADFEEFLKDSGYVPKVKGNFLKHWGSKAVSARSCPPELCDLPVVYVDLDDARAYAKWAGKRLPTEAEWQYAAQGNDGRKWPWGQEDDPAKRNGDAKGPTPVRSFPESRGPNGLYDTVGNVYQWTESERLGGNCRYCILRGGSWYDAKGSGWYVQGGAHPLDHHTKFLLLGPALNRCATIGFRCVKDVK